MAKSRRQSALLINLLLVLGLAAIWIGLAPTKLGGQITYVMINGISMEPGFHTGDLAIVRTAADYRVGDVITYYDPKMQANVIHRIIAMNGERYILQGDNNAWIDDHEPTQAEILGKLWLHLPNMGAAVAWLRVPLNMALLASILGALLMTNMIVQSPNQTGKTKQGANPGEFFETALYICLALGLTFLVLAVFAFSKPLMRPADSIPYQHTGVFSYSASGTPGVYDTGAVRTGEPIFLKLTCTLNLGFTYRLEGEQLENIRGNQKFYAMVLDEQSGWQRTIPLSVETDFSGESYAGTATLDLCQVQALIAAVEQETGYHSNAYTLAIAARVLVGGQMAHQAFSDTFEARIDFRFDSLRFYLVGNTAQKDILQTVESGSLANPEMVGNAFNLFGLTLNVMTMRLIAGVGLFLSLDGLLALGLLFYLAARRGQETLIRIKYGALLMDVHDRGLEILSPIIDVDTIEDLAKLAVRQNAMIMHLQRDEAHYYLVQSGTATYCYLLGADGASSTPADGADGAAE